MCYFLVDVFIYIITSKETIRRIQIKFVFFFFDVVVVNEVDILFLYIFDSKALKRFSSFDSLLPNLSFFKFPLFQSIFHWRSLLAMHTQTHKQICFVLNL